LDLDARPVQFAGARWAHGALALVGWRVVFNGLPAKQGVLIVYPHTSNWDFPLGLLTLWATGFNLSFWAKDSLFRWPVFGRLLKRWGGIPVQRNAAQGVVVDTTRRLQEAARDDRTMWVGLSPEGTRSHRDAWRSGFYHLTLGAKVPLGLGFIDYATRTVGIDCFIELSGDVDADMAAIAAVLAKRRGLKPHQAAPIRLGGNGSKGEKS
jgi:1-acyl-sn-glycerol-3-phosphate acyltransferase